MTRARTARWRPTRLWYASTWRCARVAAAHLPSRGGDFVLNVYPALSLLGLLVLWLVGLGVGWASIYWGLTETVAGNGDWVSLAYFSGTSLLTPAFGLLRDEGVRFLSLVETLSGLGHRSRSSSRTFPRSMARTAVAKLVSSPLTTRSVDA